MSKFLKVGDSFRGTRKAVSDVRKRKVCNRFWAVLATCGPTMARPRKADHGERLRPSGKKMTAKPQKTAAKIAAFCGEMRNFAHRNHPLSHYEKTQPPFGMAHHAMLRCSLLCLQQGESPGRKPRPALPQRKIPHRTVDRHPLG